mgnify:CR=1 FL=1
MTAPDLYSAVAPFPERFNLCDYYLERKYPSFGNLAPRDVSSRAAKRMCDEGRGVGPTKLAVYLDFRDAIKRYTLARHRHESEAAAALAARERCRHRLDELEGQLRVLEEEREALDRRREEPVEVHRGSRGLSRPCDEDAMAVSRPSRSAGSSAGGAPRIGRGSRQG